MRTRILLILCLLSAAGAQTTKPSIAQVERGRYLVENLADCFTCHSEMDWKAPQPLPGRKGSGAPFPLKSIPFPVYSPNLSSDPETGIGRWTDEQLGRAIREGIGRDGRVLFPVMPYMGYRAMSDKDVAAVIAYLRTIPPVKKANVTPTVPDEVRKQLPHPPPLARPVPEPDGANSVKRGAYLASIAGCFDCHTPFNEMQPMVELAFSGGQLMEGPWGSVTTANLTPDPSGLSAHNAKSFIQVIRTGHSGKRALNTLMPWPRFRNLTDQDLSAIFDFLQTLKPIRHFVDNTQPPTLCKVCRGTHGGGNKN